MCVTICGRFCPDEGVVAGYDNRIRAKYTAKWGVQIAGMLFQTRSSKDKNIINGRIKSINIPHRYTLSGVDIIRSFYALLERKIIPKICPSNSPALHLQALRHPLPPSQQLPPQPPSCFFPRQYTVRGRGGRLGALPKWAFDEYSVRKNCTV